MTYKYKVVYVTADGRQHVADCQSSSGIALSIARIRLNEGAQKAVIEIEKVEEAVN